MTQAASSGKTVLTAAPFELAARIVGAGPDLLLFHGGSGSHNHWIRNIDVLSRHFRVIAIDLPGYGDSPDVPESYGPDGYIDLLHEAVNRLPLSEGPMRLAGFSFGGAVAGAFAQGLGDRLHKLSLIGPAGFGIPEGRTLGLRSLKNTDGSEAALKEVIRYNLGVLMLHAPDAITEEAIALHQSNIARTRFDSLKLSWRATLLPNLASVRCPVQILWGEYDRAAHPSVGARLALCRETVPLAQLNIVPGAGHWVQFEKAGEVNAAMLAFLSD